MKSFKRLTIFTLIILMVSTVFFAGCGKKEEAAAPGASVPEATKYKFASVFPGSIQDADYNTLGYIATQDVGQRYKIDTAYSEKVAVPDAERVMKEYINDGFNIIWVHGSQFNGAALNLAGEYPEVVFIVEVDDTPQELNPNIWFMDRNFYTGFYVLGSVAALTTETGNIGYLGGLELPFTKGELNAMQQALDDLGSTAKINYIFVGDMNDSMKARQAAEGLISQDVDVIISSVNLGNYGLFNAVKDSDKQVFVTTKYTDKEVHAPENYFTTDLFDFGVPVIEITGNVIGGEKGGLINLEYGEGKARYTQFPILNVPESISERVLQIAKDVESGKINVIKNLASIDVK